MNYKLFYVYIVTNKWNSVLYTGVTNNLVKRSFEHRNGKGSIFTSKYKLTKLVYFEIYNDINLAINREKQIKAGSRNNKIKLIMKDNPNFKDLYEEIIL